MTSQIALLNDSGIAVASDTAVTITGSSSRTFSSSKIYQLSGRQPVGFMTHGNGSYRSIPLSNIFGEFREWYANHPLRSNPEDSSKRADPNRELDTLLDYTEKLRNFLSNYPNQSGSAPSTSQNLSASEKRAFEYEMDKFLQYKIESYSIFERVSDVLVYANASTLSRYNPAAQTTRRFFETELDDGVWATINKKMKGEIKTVHQEMLEDIELMVLQNETNAREFTKLKRSMARTYSSIITPFLEKFLNRHNLPKSTHMKLLKELIYKYLIFGDDSGFKYIPPTGIVIFGFGKKESQPRLIELQIGSWRSGEDTSTIASHKVIGIRGETLSETPPENSGYRVNTAGSWICTFAQDAEMQSIITGVHEDLIGDLSYFLSNNLVEILQPIIDTTQGIGKKTAKNLVEELTKSKTEIYYSFFNEIKRRRDAHIFNTRHSNIHNSITLLPIRELANFAESLLDMESTIAYYSRQLRTVGGHTDVAIVTKEDGFLWVKSEQRVDYSLNPRQQVAPRYSANLK